MENQPKSYKNGISENQLKSQNTESWISRNPLRQNDGKSPEILKDGMKGGQSDGKSPEILKDETSK